MTHLSSSQSEVTKLGRVLVKHPSDAFRNQSHIDESWQALHYVRPPDFTSAAREHDAFTQLLRRLGAEPVYLPKSAGTGLDSLYVRDAAVACEHGVILCRMGKTARQAEPTALGDFLAGAGVPVLGAITEPGIIEGGDVAWLDSRTIAVGQGYRTNREGIAQLQALLADRVDHVITVPLPHWHGKEDVFHLMSILSPVDVDKLLVYSPLLPVPFREYLLDRGFSLVEVAPEEFDTMGCNVLAAGDGHCIMTTGNPQTRGRLQHAGLTVHEYTGDHISLAGQGGPTCLTRPLTRVSGFS